MRADVGGCSLCSGLQARQLGGSVAAHTDANILLTPANFLNKYPLHAWDQWDDYVAT